MTYFQHLLVLENLSGSFRSILISSVVVVDAFVKTDRLTDSQHKSSQKTIWGMTTLSQISFDYQFGLASLMAHVVHVWRLLYGDAKCLTVSTLRKATQSKQNVGRNDNPHIRGSFMSSGARTLFTAQVDRAKFMGRKQSCAA